MSSNLPETLDKLWVTINGNNFYLRDVRAALAEHGLEVTTQDAVDWGTEYPHKAQNITQICALEQRRDALEAGYDTTAQTPTKDAAE